MQRGYVDYWVAVYIIVDACTCEKDMRWHMVWCSCPLQANSIYKNEHASRLSHT